jgi:iron complex transport system substrate-binding protein
MTDALGREVTIPAKPQRIVGIFASNVEILAAVGAGNRIVGIEDYTRFPPELTGLPKVGGRLGFSPEAIAKLGADFVVMTPSRQAANQLLRPLEAIGIPALVIDARDVDSVFGNIMAIGYAIGAEHEAADVIDDMAERIRAVTRAVRDRPPVRVYMETGSNDRGGYLSVREGTYTADMIRLAGGRNVFADISGIVQVGGESVHRARPDVILIAGTERQAQSVKDRAGWGSIDAVANGRVHVIARPLTLIPGPRIVEGIERLARIFHPQAFAP